MCLCQQFFLTVGRPLNSLFTNASHLIPLLSPRLAIRIRTIPPSLEEEERGTSGGEGWVAGRGSGEADGKNPASSFFSLLTLF